MGFIHWLKIADERIRKHPHWRKIDGTPWANDAATIAATLAAEAEQAALSALQAEVERLREALRPFADLGEPFMRNTTNDDSVWVSCADAMEIYFGRPSVPGWRLSVGQLRAAVRALSRGE